MSISKEWDWSKENNSIWLSPSEESYYVVQRWKEKGYKRILDFGCGLGRHSVLFAKEGYCVNAFDLSVEATEYLKYWAEEEQLSIEVKVADMQNLPYPDDSFDAVFAYHVISHTDTLGIRQILGEISRILKPGGELYMTLCSKETWSFKDAGYPKLDNNTVIKTVDGPEKDIPHFYVNLDDIIELLPNFEIVRIRHTDDCYFAKHRQNSKHFFILAKLKE